MAREKPICLAISIKIIISLSNLVLIVSFINLELLDKRRSLENSNSEMNPNKFLAVLNKFCPVNN